jgi:hypothetical protein
MDFIVTSSHVGRMSPDRDFINRIEYPDHAALQGLRDDACETTRSRLEEWGYPDVDESTIRKLSYTYYYDPSQDDPDYVFLLQDPGGIQRRHTEELERLKAIDDQSPLTELVDIYRQFPKSWLLRNRNSDFSLKFFSTLSDHGIISLSSTWRDYLRDEGFYHDFYMTDIVKYRVDGFTKREERESVNEFLREELAMIDPDLIFVFGGDAWDVLRGYFDTTPIDTTTVDTSKITEIHGCLCRTGQELDAHVLPLSHMSGQVWWRFPPEEYIERMEAGLREWSTIH